MLPRLKSLFVIAATLVGLTGPGIVDAGQTPHTAAPLTIRVDGNDWGAVSKQDIEAALYSAANALMPEATSTAPRTIVVTHSNRSPVVLYERGPGGEYQIMLHAQESDWHLYVYEFAHEYCHVLSNYDEHAGDGRRHNQWFEESLCETASLYALQTLAEDWQVTPPTPRLAGASKQLRWFFELLMDEKHRHEQDTDLAAWLKDSADELRQDPYQRRKNEVVATRMLPLFDASQRTWEALRYLNLDNTDKDCSFDAYLEHWYRNVPGKQKALVAEIRTLLLEDGATPPTAPLTIAKSH